MLMDRKIQYFQDKGLDLYIQCNPNQNCSKLIYTFSAIPIKIAASYFVDINKMILKFI